MTITRHPLLVLARRYLLASLDAYAPGHTMSLAYVPQEDPAGPPAWPFITLSLGTVSSDGIRGAERRPYAGQPGQVATWSRAVVRVSVYAAEPSVAWTAARSYLLSSKGSVWTARQRVAVRDVTDLIIVTDELDGAGNRIRGDFDIVLAQGARPINIGADVITSVAVEVD